jgi:hypothetical protein
MPTRPWADARQGPGRYCLARSGDFGGTRVYHLSQLELDSRAEEGTAGVLTWDGGAGNFAYLDPAWLRTVTRHNWKHR